MFNNIINQLVGNGYKSIKRIVYYFSFKCRRSYHTIMLNLYKRDGIQENDTIKQLFKALVKSKRRQVTEQYRGYLNLAKITNGIRGC